MLHIGKLNYSSTIFYKNYDIPQNQQIIRGTHEIPVTYYKVQWKGH